MDNPYKVIQQVFQTPEQLQDELNKQHNAGFRVLSIWRGPGDYVNIVLVQIKSAAMQNFGTPGAFAA